jgi:hypothetical protein
MATSTALVKIEMPSAPLAKIEQLRETFDRLSQVANVLAPMAMGDTILPLHAVSLRAVIVDGQSETYSGGFCKSGTRALGKVALRKIAAAAGMQMLGNHRCDDGSDPHYCRIQAAVRVRDFDGTWRPVIQTRAVDLREGSATAKRMTPQELNGAREHIESLAESKALNRCIRDAFALKQTYTPQELQRPFVIPKLVPALDPNDPEDRKALRDMAMGREAALYGGAGAAIDPALPMLPAPPTTPPPPVNARASEADDDDEDEDSSADDDFGDVPTLPAAEELALILCLCPCGDQREITKETSSMTTERVGSPRCSACYPGKKFDFDRHKEIKDLRMPKAPALKTADDVHKALEAAGAKK